MSNLWIAYPDIPKRAIVTHASDAYAVDARIRNLRRGHRWNFAMLAAAASQTYVEYDMGAANTAAADHLIIARADMLQSDGVDCVTLTGSNASRTAPLQTSVAPTYWIDFSDDAQVTQDAQRRISAVANKSGTAAGMTQATDAAKFVRTRRDNLENWFTYSEQFDRNNPWYPTNLTKGTADQAVAPDGKTTAETLLETSATGEHNIAGYAALPTINSGTTYRLSVYAKGVNRSYIRMRLSNGFAANSAFFNIAPGAGAVGTVTGSTASVVDAGNGWFRCIMEVACNSTVSNSNFYFNVSTDGATVSYPGDTSSSHGVYLWGAQFQPSLASSTYCPTTDTPMYRGVNGRAAARANGAQYMTSTATLDDILNNNAKTIFVVTRPNAVGGLQCIFGDNSEYSWLRYYDTGGGLGKYDYLNYDGTGDHIGAASAVAPGGTHILAITHDGVNLTLSDNGVASTPVASGATSLMTAVLRLGYLSGGYAYLNGDVSEVIAYDAVLSAGDLASVYAYLAAKYLNPPTYQTTTFNSATLYGPHAADFVTTFATSSAYRYWWLDYAFGDGVTTSTFPRSKEYFGMRFDPGVNPSAFEGTKKINVDSKLEFPTGNHLLTDAYDVLAEYKIEWANMSDANAAIALSLLNEAKRDLVFLNAAAYPAILNGQSLVHCQIQPNDCWSEAVDVNCDKVTMRFVEDLG